MTLNITVVGKDTIYQSADYRLRDWDSGEYRDFQTQKIFLVNRAGWNATVCFAGVGRTGKIDVATWLSDVIKSIHLRDSFEVLVERLIEADSWLSSFPAQKRHHSFSLGAFVKGNSTFVLVSNFESFDQKSLAIPLPNLQVHRFHQTAAKTFVSGATAFVARHVKRRLVKLLEDGADTRDMYRELEETNKGVAGQTDTVSVGCFVAHVTSSGQGGGIASEIARSGGAPLRYALPEVEAILKMLGPEQQKTMGTVDSISFAHTATSLQEHLIRVKQYPDNASFHTAYALYLEQESGDLIQAESELRIAIRLDPTDASALGNLANLLARTVRREEADELYRRAIACNADTSNQAANYGDFLRKGGSLEAALNVLDTALTKYPVNGRLSLLRAQVLMEQRNPHAALPSIVSARKFGADQITTEMLYAIALHMTGSPVGECISAYEVAIALQPQNAILHLNLGQLLFLKNSRERAQSALREAARLGLEPTSKLELLYYNLAHSGGDPVAALVEIRRILDTGSRLDWNMEPTIEYIRRTDPEKATKLVQLSTAMASKDFRGVMDCLESHW